MFSNNIQNNPELSAFLDKPKKTYSLRNAVLTTGAFLLSAVIFGALVILITS